MDEPPTAVSAGANRCTQRQTVYTGGCARDEPAIARNTDRRKRFRARAQEDFSFRRPCRLHLTVSQLPKIIMRTSFLWRSDKPRQARIDQASCGLDGWRQNIFL